MNFVVRYLEIGNGGKFMYETAEIIDIKFDP